MPVSLIHLAKHITLCIVACWKPFCIRPGWSIGIVTTNTKDKYTYHSSHAMWNSFNYHFLLMSYYHRITAQFNCKATKVHQVLITVNCCIAGRYLCIFCVEHHIIRPLASYSMINVLASFDSYVKIPFKKLLLYFNFVLRVSTYSCSYYPIPSKPDIDMMNCLLFKTWTFNE